MTELIDMDAIDMLEIDTIDAFVTDVFKDQDATSYVILVAKPAMGGMQVLVRTNLDACDLSGLLKVMGENADGIVNLNDPAPTGKPN